MAKTPAKRTYRKYIEEIDGKKYASVNLPLGNGKYQRKRKLVKNLTEARQWAQETLLKHREGSLPVDAAKVTFSDLVTAARADIYAPATIKDGRKTKGVKSKSYDGMLNTLENYFGHLKLSAITEAKIEDFRADRERVGSLRGKTTKGSPLKASTVNYDLRVLRRLLNYAVDKKKWLKENPLQNAGRKGIIERNKNEEARVRLLDSQTEEPLLLQFAIPGKYPIEYERTRKGKTATVTTVQEVGNVELRAAILLALDSGLRKQEIHKIDWSDLDLNSGIATIRFENTKTETGRKVPLSDRTIDELKTLPNFGSTGKVFTTTDFKRSWETAKKLAKISDLHFHDLRAAAATRWIQAGESLDVVGKLLGDRNLVEIVYKHYVRVDDRMVVNARDRMNRIIAGETI